MYDPEQVTYFAETDFRNQRKEFGMKAKDRVRHMYVIGKTGMGKSTMLENMAVQDIQNGNGIAFIDPHGGSAEKLLEYVPEDRLEDVIYFAPFDMNHPISFNIMEDVGYDKRHLVVSGLMSAFEKIWADSWSARMAYILQNTLFALLEYPDSTLLDINRMLVDKDFRNKVVENVSDPSIKAFWTEEFAKYTDRYTQEATPAIQNKIGQFVSNPVIRNIIGQPKSSFDVRDIMDNQKIMIMNLSKGQIGESNTNLLGSILITKLYLSAMSRADLSNAELAQKPNFYFYVDEFQSFANKSFADILSEARKYKLNLTIAHQYIEQMEEEVRSAVFGNVGTMVVFRVGSFDAEIFEKEFAPDFTAEDIVNLGFAQTYLRLMIDGISSKPFSATTLPPIEPQSQPMTERVIEASRRKYAAPREEVEEHIRNRMVESGVIKDDTAEKNGKDNRKRGNAPSTSKGAGQAGAQSRRSGGTDRKPESQEPTKEETHQPFKYVLAKEAPKDQEEEEREHSSKQKKQQPKQQKADPKSKNKDALRAALADLVGEQKQTTQTPSVSHANESKEPESQAHVAGHTSGTSKGAWQAPHTERSDTKQHTTPEQEKSTGNTQNTQQKKTQSNQSPPEVPEEVLRKTLE